MILMKRRDESSSFINQARTPHPSEIRVSLQPHGDSLKVSPVDYPSRPGAPHSLALLPT